MIPRYSREIMTKIWTDQARFELWLEIETLALEGMIELGVVPAEAGKSVREKGAFDVDRVLEIEATVKHDVIAFLTNVAENVGEDARYLHLGMTSSDLLDTSFAVQLCQATDIVLQGVDTLLESVEKRAKEHKRTICVGRSHGIHAEPTTFGLKLAVFYEEIKRARARIVAAREEVAVGAVSGPVGTFAHLSPKVEEFVCEKVGLKPDPVSTQIISRDRHASLFGAFALLASSLENMVVEVRHLQRTEVREAEEYFSAGQKGSSAMPHKRNPVLSENVTGLARLIRGWASTALENITLWHERDISHSSVERVIAPDITVTLDFMLARTNGIFANLIVYPDRMEETLNSTNGLVHSGTILVALAKKGLSREDAYALVQSHAMDVWNDLTSEDGPTGADFETRIRGDEKILSILSAEDLAESFSLESHMKHVDFIFNRVFV